MVRSSIPAPTDRSDPSLERSAALRLGGRVVLVAGDDDEDAYAHGVAAALAHGGADIALAPSPERLDDAVRTLAHIEAAGRRGLVVTGDLDDALSCRHVVREVVRALGRIDVVVDVGEAPSDRASDLAAAASRHATGVTVVDPASATDAAAITHRLLEGHPRAGVAWSRAAWSRLTDDVRSGATALRDATMRLHDRVRRPDTPPLDDGGPSPYVSLPRTGAPDAAEVVISLLEGKSSEGRLS